MMKKNKLALILFWLGAIFAFLFAGVIGHALYDRLRTLTLAQLNKTIWTIGSPLFMLWALSITIGSILAGLGAFLYVKTNKKFSWFLGLGVFTIVYLMTMVWNKVYHPLIFGINGLIILIAFFTIIWLWMKKYANSKPKEKTAASFKLIGYIFWINASWFLCGDSAKMHLKVFEGQPAPTPIEIMVFLVLGWVFILIGEYKELKTK